MTTYEVIRDQYGIVQCILKDGVTSIPNRLENPLYLEFLAWNSAQTVPLDLMDHPVPKRRPRGLNLLRQEIEALTASDRQKLFVAIAAEFLQRRPAFALMLGININGDEPIP